MFLEIESAIEAYLQQSGLEVLDPKAVTYQYINPEKPTRWTRGAVLDIITLGGDHQAYNNEIRESIQISVIIVTEAPRSMDDRRRKIYPIIQAVMSLLAWEDFDLHIAPLEPGRFMDITTRELDNIGMAVWRLDFATDYTLELLPREDALELLQITLNYPDLDEMDTVIKPEEDNGSAP